ncbi:MAG: UPF0182 family protein [Microcoleus sp.]
MTLNRRIYQVILLVAGLWLVLELVSRAVAEILWFQEVGYLQVLLLRLKTQGLLGVIPTAISAVFLMGNLALAHSLKHPTEETKSPISGGLFASVNLKKTGNNYQLSVAKPQLAFPWLLLLLFGLSSIAGFMVIHLGLLAAGGLADFSIAPPIQLGLESIGPIAVQLFSNWWQFGVMLGLMLAVTIKPDFWLRAIALFLSLAIGLIAASRLDKSIAIFSPS